ncbi:MAG: hypothetical protein ACREQV_21920, partial [Candidatus Binatia bacterium]
MAPRPGFASFIGFLTVSYERNRLLLHGLISIGLGIALWELIDRIFDDKTFFTGPDEVFVSYVELFREGSIWIHIRYSALEG